MRAESKAKKIAFTGVMGALAIAFSFLESLIPPMPGMPPGAKLGLSNVVTMFAAGSLGLSYALVIALIKGVFALLTRGVTAGLMSIAGGLLSTVVMWAILKKTNASLAVVGICGALAHNAAQLCIAIFLMKVAALYYAPFMLIFGILTGFLTGLILKVTLPPLERLSSYFGIEKQ